MSATPPDDGRTEFAPTAKLPPLPPAAPKGSANALPAGTVLGEFELQGAIGEGGFGIVYRAWDRTLKRQVAIKEYLPASLAMRGEGTQVSVRSDADREPFDAGLASFLKEAQMLAQFDHPSLVKVYRFWEANGSAYMVMPFYEGRTLRDELRRRREPVDEATLLGWLGPVADALAVVHAEHCYHRDIAPDNVLLLNGSDRPLLLDFGAARRVIGDMTQALTVILKPGYAPVEQYAEIPGMKQGPWTDVYALAGVAHFALRGRTPPTSVGRLVNDQYEKLAGSALEGRFSAQVLAAVDHALAVRPENRTASVEQFKAELGLTPPPAALSTAGAARPLPAPAPEGIEVDLALPDEPPRPPMPTMQPTERFVRPAPADATMRVPPPSAPARAAAAAPVAAAVPVPAAANGGGRRWVGVGLAAVVVAGAAGYLGLRPAGQVPAEPTAVPPQAVAPAAAPPAPSAPPAVAPAVAPVAQAFDVAAEFERVAAAQTPGWGLEVKLDRDPLRIGRDKLAFTLRSLQDGYVYVFSHGSDGLLQQLYPNGLTPPPRVAKGGTLRLPQGSLEFNVDGPAGTTRLLVMVSRWPREHKAFAPRVEGGFTSFPTGAEAARLSAAAGAGVPLVAGRAECPAGSACRDEFGAATLRFEVVP